MNLLLKILKRFADQKLAADNQRLREHVDHLCKYSAALELRFRQEAIRQTRPSGAYQIWGEPPSSDSKGLDRYRK